MKFIINLFEKLTLSVILTVALPCLAMASMNCHGFYESSKYRLSQDDRVIFDIWKNIYKNRYSSKPPSSILSKSQIEIIKQLLNKSIKDHGNESETAHALYHLKVATIEADVPLTPDQRKLMLTSIDKIDRIDQLVRALTPGSKLSESEAIIAVDLLFYKAVELQEKRRNLKKVSENVMAFLVQYRAFLVDLKDAGVQVKNDTLWFQIRDLYSIYREVDFSDINPITREFIKKLVSDLPSHLSFK